ncbi:type II secretion system protein E [Halorubrum aidingense JCM 13560]|uniref:Type II secretion system protein E n=1 Tax=Halorubrum aidingense JCM 13560 TaxID=1230454 RepID=M0P632_9EURY|nr:type II/IV secretion system ATPase subunit [Halorubrum aidingense]EMA65298.1 type II secretion system protein E [Halorubrum aidingense JCM 13560]
MSDGPTLRIVDDADDDPGGAVPAPVPPDDPEAWYAPEVRAQYESEPGVVATVRERDGGRFGYGVREPPLSPADERALARVRDHFSAVRHRRPLTRVGVIERAAAGFEPKYAQALDRLLDATAAARRRIDYHALCDLRLLGDLTPVALDDRIEVADVGDERELVVHTETFAPLETGIDADAEYVERVAAERLAQYAVGFAGLSVDVVVYRERLLGSDAFETKYAVLEPDLLPGDEALIDECKERIWETTVDGVVDDREAFVAAHARRFLSRRLTARNTRAWLDAATHRARAALAERGIGVPPVDSRYAHDRLDDLAYYVLRDFVGEGILTVPIRDPNLEDVEANRVGERVKVIPRASIRDAGDDAEAFDGTGTRVPTNLAFADETTFVNVATGLAARDGTELNASTPSAKVNLDIDGVDETIRCAVALPVISEGGPHVSIRKQRADAMTPIDLVDRGTLSTELVTLLWLLYEHRGVVLFAGPTGVGKTTLLNAHTPFIPFDDRPVSIDEGSREVRLPHETGVSLTTRDHEEAYKAVSMAELMTEANYLNPDVEVIAEINTPASFDTFAETLNTGHGVIGTTHAEDVEALVNRVIERGLAPYLLREVDLVVFPRQVGGDRYVSRAVELLSAAEYEALDSEAKRSPTGNPKHGGAGVVEKGGEAVYFNTIAWRDADGRFRFPGAPDAGGATGTGGATGAAGAGGAGSGPTGSPVATRDAAPRLHAFARIADHTDRAVDAVESEFAAKHRYVEYLVREGVDDFDALFEFLADLRTDEAATVERAARTMDEGDRP